MASLKLRVEGMTGPACERRIEDALRAERGVYGAVANRREHCVEVDIEDDEVTLERVIEIVEGVGYRANLAG
ncbi:MAG: heavy-metal-associated domain-containing protein [Longimicrobiales bacterium]